MHFIFYFFAKGGFSLIDVSASSTLNFDMVILSNVFRQVMLNIENPFLLTRSFLEASVQFQLPKLASSCTYIILVSISISDRKVI